MKVLEIFESADKAKEALEDWTDELSRGSRGLTIDDIEKDGTGFTRGIRDWGNWKVPDGEEDDGDYDWQILTPESSKKFDQIKAKVQARHPGVKLSSSGSEKNWIQLHAK